MPKQTQSLAVNNYVYETGLLDCKLACGDAQYAAFLLCTKQLSISNCFPFL